MYRKLCFPMLALLCLALGLVSCQSPTPSLPEQSTQQTTQAPTQEETTQQATTQEITTEEVTTAEPVDVEYKTVQNPVCEAGDDPWIITHGNDYYYCFAYNNGVAVTKLSSIHKVAKRGAQIVYQAPAGTSYSYDYWAPELHYIRGEWYIYVAADNGDNANHRMYVLKGTSQDPRDPFVMIGQITSPDDKWAIDGTVLQLGGELYFIWSGWEGDVDGAQHIYIAHMSDPCTIDSERVLLSSPTYSWETFEWPDVNEGPTALVHGDDVFIVYSASGSWSDYYCLGMLTLTGDDPLNPDHWEKSAEPVFEKKDGLAYGPGHCSFATAHDGSIWMIYHANQTSGSGWNGRSVWISPVLFDENGTPDFGEPTPEVTFPVPVK